MLTATMPKCRGRKGGVASKVRTLPRVPMETSLEVPGRSSNTTQCGSIYNMSDYASPCFSMVHSPVSYFGPYSQYTCPPFLQAMPPESSNVFAPHQQYYQPPTPFSVCFITGNISVCFGCKNKYPKSPKPPQDICIKHEQWREVTTGTKQQSKFGNVYYYTLQKGVYLVALANIHISQALYSSRTQFGLCTQGTVVFSVWD